MLSRNLARTQNHLPQVKPRPGRARPPGSSARRALPITQSLLTGRTGSRRGRGRHERAPDPHCGHHPRSGQVYNQTDP
jgi:hypothetical protein